MPATLAQSLVLAVMSQVALVITYSRPMGTYADYLTATSSLTVWMVYLPCLAMVLRRPNEGETPDWLDRLVVATTGAAARRLRVLFGR